MIKTGEIDRKANEQGVRATQIQKDYVISWILWGISKSQLLSENLIFKGGTCLKKVYFNDYRFSEDLDFTLKDDEISEDDLIQAFESLFQEVYEEVRITMSIKKDSLETHEDSGSIKFIIGYKGPHGPDTIKVDLTRGEIMQFDERIAPIFRDYSDLEEEIKIKCYSLEEILIEKMAALMGRTIPRDLYDFDYIVNIEGLSLEDVFIEFMSKAENKGHDPKEFSEKVTAKKKTFNQDWQNSLQNQMRKDALPEFDGTWRDAGKAFRELDKLLES